MNLSNTKITKNMMGIRFVGYAGFGEVAFQGNT